MSLYGDKIFSRKPSDNGKIYKWQVIDTLPKKVGAAIKLTSAGCTAELGTQGNDFINNYVYNTIIIGGILHKYAYVACDYVQ